METNPEAGGTLDDALAAGAAGRRAALPWWLLTLDVLLVAGLWSAVFGGEQTWRNILLSFAVFALPVLAVWAITRRRGRVGAFAPGSRAAVVFWSGFFGAMFAAMFATGHLEPGRPLTYLTVFLLVVVIYGGGRIAAERIAVGRPA
ncbi:hypothetical protein TPB0596_34210 [Tsukamurella pulmonis]|uniref:hypothetical protein n=1 Tax=Tsukamurella pulmonis TaxID=47312 RepID=UPI000795D128|nr:hypothetical protein [Tsukamurella pulmonis]KXP10908.1 hypothetical protein AXK57_05890 [Tsukamurella pulmonis]RDH13146.1 hypothetical protein DVB88_03955 [Tsukamurella pulmonis]BDD83658.1 hypothetical protein TPB0596_34210 [Tsukamurella pulmonis]